VTPYFHAMGQPGLALAYHARAYAERFYRGLDEKTRIELPIDFGPRLELMIAQTLEHLPIPVFDSERGESERVVYEKARDFLDRERRLASKRPKKEPVITNQRLVSPEVAEKIMSLRGVRQ
jgi:hypothetical protein